MRFFKKIDARQQILLSNGQWFSFVPAGDFGLFSTEDPGLIAQFQIAIASQRGGLSEITEAEYQDLKKKPKLTRRLGPEKISPQFLQKLKNSRSDAGRVVVEAIAEAPFQNIVEPLQPSEYRPISVKRA